MRLAGGQQNAGAGADGDELATLRRAAVRFRLKMREADMPELPPETPTAKPHTARIYDYYLGGKNHFPVDREVAEKSLASVPSARIGAREQRAFLGRAVRYLAGEAGIRQFLDIGAGLPTTGNVHEVAQAIVPSARVVYVDNDPLVLPRTRGRCSPRGRRAAPPISTPTCDRRPRSCLRLSSGRCSTFRSRSRSCSWGSCTFLRTRTGRSGSSPPCLMPCRRARTSPLRISTRNMTRWAWPQGCAPIVPAGSRSRPVTPASWPRSHSATWN